MGNISLSRNRSDECSKLIGDPGVRGMIGLVDASLIASRPRLVSMVDGVITSILKGLQNEQRV